MLPMAMDRELAASLGSSILNTLSHISLNVGISKQKNMYLEADSK